MRRAVLLLLALASGCGRAPELPRPEPRPNLVLVTLDTTRADRIGAYGYDGARTDAIDALAARGRRYDRAYAPAPLTIPSHAALFTGIWPARLGIRDNGSGVLTDDAVTLAEVLSDAGYATAASVSAYVTTARWGFSQGFDTYLDDVPVPRDANFWHASRKGADVVDDLLAWKASRGDDRPAFVWAHLFDAHYPYTPEPAWADAQPGRPYDAEIAYLDDQVARLVDAWSDEPTVFVVVADHGESLGDHGELTHGLFVYDATQRVPLIVAGPGIAPDVVTEPVSLVDVVPTVLDLLGVPAPEGIDGRVAPGAPPRPIHLEAWQLWQRFGIAPHLGVIDGDDKLVSLPRPELYDVVADPGERNDRADADPERVRALQRILDGFGFPPPDDAAVLDPDVADQLAALGYTAGEGADAAGPAVDPKDRIDLLRDVQRASRLEDRGQRAEAEALLRSLIERYPDIVSLRSRHARLLARLGRADEADVALRDALRIAPDSPTLRYALAGQLARERRFEEASALYRELVDDLGHSPRIRVLAVATLREVRPADAVELGLAWLRERPDDAALAGVVGVELAKAGRRDEARAWLERGARADVPEPDVLFALARLADARGDAVEATRLLEEELSHYPGNRKAGVALLRRLGAARDWEGQVRVTERMLERAPDDVRLLHADAQARFNLGRYAEAREVLDRALSLAPEASGLLLLDANLLAKEGDRARGEARFEEARRARERERAAGSDAQ